MAQGGNIWNEYLDNLEKLAENNGCKLDEPVYTCHCGYCKLTTTIRPNDGRDCVTITADDISDLSSKVEDALKSAV